MCRDAELFEALDRAITKGQSEDILRVFREPAWEAIKHLPEIQHALGDRYARILSTRHEILNDIDASALYEMRDSLLLPETYDTCTKSVIAYWRGIICEKLADTQHPEHLEETSEFVEDKVGFLLHPMNEENGVLLYEGLRQCIESGALLKHEKAWMIPFQLFLFSSFIDLSARLAQTYIQIFDLICPYASSAHGVFSQILDLAFYFCDYSEVKEHLRAAGNNPEYNLSQYVCFESLLRDLDAQAAAN